MAERPEAERPLADRPAARLANALLGAAVSLVAVLGPAAAAAAQDPVRPPPIKAPPVVAPLEGVVDTLVARLERPVEGTAAFTIGGVAWSCDGDTCRARSAAAGLAACRTLRGRVGPIAAFRRGDHRLDPDEIAACNAPALDPAPGAVRLGDGRPGRRPPAETPARPAVRRGGAAPELARDVARPLAVAAPIAAPIAAPAALERALAGLLPRVPTDRYRVYRLDPAGRWDGIWRKEWRGRLALPRGAALGEIVAVRFLDDHDRWIRDDDGRIIRDRFHLQPGGAYAKRILDSAGRPAGILAVSPGGALAVSLDVDHDAAVDLMTVLAPDGREYLVVGERVGRKALDAWWGHGRNPLCLDTDARVGGGAGAPAATLQGCGDRREDAHRGVGVTAGPGAGDGGGDPIDAVCRDALSGGGGPVDPTRSLVANDRASGQAGRFGVRIIREGFDGETDSKAVQIARAITAPLWFGSLVLGGVAVDAATDPVGDYDAMGEGLAEAGRKAAAVGDDDEPDDAPPPRDAGPAERPLPDDAATADEVLRGLCARRQQAWWPGSLDDLDRQFVTQRCADPKVAPSPATTLDQRELSSWCGREDGDRSGGSLGGLLGEGGGGRGCGVLERPGPDGRCRGTGAVFRTRDPALGTIAVALGLVIPLPCPGPGCDPAGVP